MFAGAHHAPTYIFLPISSEAAHIASSYHTQLRLPALACLCFQMCIEEELLDRDSLPNLGRAPLGITLVSMCDVIVAVDRRSLWRKAGISTSGRLCDLPSFDLFNTFMDFAEHQG
jgi:hypothetical protein